MLAEAARLKGSGRANWLALAPLVLLIAVPLVHPVVGHPGDESAYLLYAHNLLHGHYAGDPRGVWLAHGPGLPLVIAPFVAIHAPILVTRLIGPICLLLSAVVTYKLARLYVSHRLAVLSAFIVGFYPPAVLLLRQIYSEPLAMLLVAMAAYQVASYVQTRRRSALVAAGLTTGALALTRVEFAYVILPLLLLSVVCWRTRPGRIGAWVCGIALIVTIPWLVYTYSLTHRVFYWSSSGGGQIYWMASPHSSELGDWHASPTVFTDSNLAVERPFFSKVDRINALGQDRAFERRALRDIEQHPAHYARNVVLNASRIVFNVPYSFTSFKLTSAVFFGLPACTLIVLSCLGVWRRRLPEFVVFAAVVGLAFVVHALAAAYGRMFLPTMPLMVAPALTVVADWSRLRRDSASPGSPPLRWTGCD